MQVKMGVATKCKKKPMNLDMFKNTSERAIVARIAHL